MKYTLRNVPLPPISAKDRERLMPFALVLEDVLVPRARRAGFRAAGRGTLNRLSRLTDRILRDQFGHAVEPVIALFALRRCGQMYAAAIDQAAPVALQRTQLRLMDCIWRLVVELQQFHGLDELLLLVSSL